MTEQVPDQQERPEEHDGNSPVPIQEKTLFSYYRDEVENTGGMKVKWTIRVAAGQEAQRLDDRQNHAIRELLEWAAHRQQPHTSQAEQEPPPR